MGRKRLHESFRRFRTLRRCEKPTQVLQNRGSSRGKSFRLLYLFIKPLQNMNHKRAEEILKPAHFLFCYHQAAILINLLSSQILRFSKYLQVLTFNNE